MSEREHEDEQDQKTEGPVLSEGGSALGNAETSRGGADSVPDTPDVNTPISDAVDINEQGAKSHPGDPRAGR